MEHFSVHFKSCDSLLMQSDETLCQKLIKEDDGNVKHYVSFVFLKVYWQGLLLYLHLTGRDVSLGICCLTTGKWSFFSPLPHYNSDRTVLNTVRLQACGFYKLIMLWQKAWAVPLRTIRSHSLLVWTLHKLGPQRKWVPVGRTTDLFYKKKIKINK